MNSIRMPAVRVNQIAANTGAVVRNFFMAKRCRVESGERGARKLSGARR